MTGRLAELREAMERADEARAQANQAYEDARQAYNAELIASAPHPAGTVLENGKGERLKISRWEVRFGGLTPFLIRPKKDGTFGTREHREWSDAWKEWKVEAP